MDVVLSKKLLNLLRRGGPKELMELSRELGVNIDKLRGVIEELRKREALKLYVESLTLVFPGEKLLELKTLPEILLFNELKNIGRISLRELQNRFSYMDPGDIKAGLGKLISKGVVTIKKEDDVNLVELILKEPKYIVEVEKIINKVLNYPNGIELGSFSKDELNLIKELSKRPGILIIKEDHKTFIRKGDNLEQVIKELEEEISSLTPDIIVSGIWKNKKFKKYDLNEKPFVTHPAKLHPLHELVNEIREIFLSMGFEEARGPLVELAFVNFDMLFQPQDHPARDMQDTFYIKEPKYGKITYPDEIVDHVRQTHESGWVTGSSGWGGKWSINEARKLLLRTHTTAVSVRKVYELGEREAKIFSIGRVFRNETVDYKHLAEFMQIDGIIISKNGNLRQLMGVIEEFYNRLGFKDVRFWPSYFPYTEPSLQPSIYVSKWGKWLELGGAGIFRPEVTYPLGVKWPVLAWGLGIERILMIKYDLDDIRVIYENNLKWLRHVPILR